MISLNRKTLLATINYLRIYEITRRLLFILSYTQLHCIGTCLLHDQDADDEHPAETKRFSKKFQRSSRSRQIAEDVMQNAAMAQILDFNFGIDAAAKHNFP